MSVKVVSIGCGRHARKVHEPSWSKIQRERTDVVLAACCDLSKEAAESYMEKFGYRRMYTDIDTMLDAEQPDLVSLVAPEPYTAQLARRILEQGYPIILEKPPGRTKEETLGLIETARRSGTLNRVAFNRRYTPLTRKLKELLASEVPAASTVSTMTCFVSTDWMKTSPLQRYTLLIWPVISRGPTTSKFVMSTRSFRSSAPM